MSKVTTKRRGDRGGFTLIELLLVVAIISILATLTLVVLRGAQEDARAARTQSIINRTREILLDKLDRIETRTMPLNVDQVINGANLSQKQYLRKRMLTDWILAEIPSYYEDLEYFPSTGSRIVNTTALPSQPEFWPDDMANGFWVSQYVTAVGFRPPAGLLAIRRSLLMTPGAQPPDQWNHNGGDLPPNPATLSPRNDRLRNDPTILANPDELRHALIEGAEVLYAVLYNTWYNDQRGTYFLSDNEIGDLDNDGRPEVLDGWGEPIYFLVRRSLESLEVDRDRSGTIDNTDRDLNGDSVVDFRDLIITGEHPVILSDIVIELFSTRSNQF